MLRSLYAGISGLQNEQTALDVTGNNIANVNTVGFKGSRVTFKESMTQLLQGATRPAGNAGGTNPLQIGLGMAIGSIDTLQTQGSFQTTGQITDLALDGSAFFAYSNGSAGDFYSRNGALQLDSTGKLVCPTNGYALQGMMATPDGTYPANTTIGDITIPFGSKDPAKATTEITYGSNLDSDSEGLGTVTNSNAFLRTAGADTLDAAHNPAAVASPTLTSLYDSNGNSLGIQVGDELTLSVSDGAVPNDTIKVTQGMTLDDLNGEISKFVASVSTNASSSVQNGQIVINNALGNASINGLQITSSNPTSKSYVSNALSFGNTIPVSNVPADSKTLLTPALETDDLSTLYDASGNALKSEFIDANGNPIPLQISVNGTVGVAGKPITTVTGTYGTNVTTMKDLEGLVSNAFSLPATDGTTLNNPSVSLDNADTPDDLMPDGSLVVRGQTGTAFAINNLSISATNPNANGVSPTEFNANLGFTQTQAARDVGIQSTSMVVYDESGDAHTVTTTFTQSGTPNVWNWELTTNGGEKILGGNRGQITFGQNGSPSSFTYDDNATGFSFDPMNGSNIVSLNLNPGSPGSFTGLTQFQSPSTAQAKEQDGYPMGTLQTISIDENGEISGVYSNGITHSIAKIYVADFNNPEGLLDKSNGMFQVSNNSGQAVMGQPGIGSTTTVKPGALEMSNVDLATEFTNMITTQRAYQADSKVITTSDQMLQTLVSLIQ